MRLIKANEFKEAVSKCQNIDELCNMFLDSENKPLPKSQAKEFMKQLDLSFPRKAKTPKFVLQVEDETETTDSLSQQEEEIVVEEEQVPVV